MVCTAAVFVMPLVTRSFSTLRGVPVELVLAGRLEAPSTDLVAANCKQRGAHKKGNVMELSRCRCRGSRLPGAASKRPVD